MAKEKLVEDKNKKQENNLFWLIVISVCTLGLFAIFVKYFDEKRNNKK